MRHQKKLICLLKAKMKMFQHQDKTRIQMTKLYKDQNQFINQLKSQILTQGKKCVLVKSQDSHIMLKHMESAKLSLMEHSCRYLLLMKNMDMVNLEMISKNMIKDLISQLYLSKTQNMKSVRQLLTKNTLEISQHN